VTGTHAEGLPKAAVPAAVLLSAGPVRQKETASAFRPDIEGLRGIAVLIVVAFHCGVRGFMGGFVGVDIFFVLSGYLITGHLVGEFDRTARISLIGFYARRVRRLLPASALVLAFTLIVGSVLLAPQELEFAARAARATSVYLSNVFFSINQADYFAPNVETNPILHTWTLAVEEQFYLVWPLLIVVGLEYFRSRAALLRLLCGLAVISLAISVWATREAHTFAFYQLPSRAWEFAIGGLAAIVPLRVRWLTRATWTVLGWTGFAAIILFQSFVPPTSHFPGWIALVPVLGTAIVLKACAGNAGNPVARFLDVAPLQFLGKLSYSWYLWHWPFLVFASVLVPGVSVVGKTVAVIMALGAAILAHRWVENPIRFSRSLVTRPVRTLAMGAMLMLVSVAAAQLALRFAHRLTEDPRLQRLTASVNDIADMPRAQCVTLGTDADVKSCTFADKTSTTNVVLFGDSHAIQWFNAVRGIANERSWKLTTVVKSGCAAADFVGAGSDQGAIDSCAAWRQAAIRKIVELKPSVILMASSTGWQRGAGSSRARLVRDWGNATARTLGALSASNAIVVVIRDTPALPFDAPTCLARSIRHSWYPASTCEFEPPVASSEIFAAERASATGMPFVRFLDMTPQICPRGLCTASRGDIVAFRDDNHLTGAFATSLQPALAQSLLATIQIDPVSGGISGSSAPAPGGGRTGPTPSSNR
jgi:peptidoglycan/LPS O-acetylase OafA/YrhL